MSLDELYRQVILDHYRNPRNQGSLDHPDANAEGVNPLCGDEVEVELTVRDGVVDAVAIRSQGCSISQSSASMMSEAVMGRSIEQVDDLAGQFHQMMSSTDGEEADPLLGDLAALRGVRKFPVRIKCAELAWTTLDEALRPLRRPS